MKRVLTYRADTGEVLWVARGGAHHDLQPASPIDLSAQALALAWIEIGPDVVVDGSQQMVVAGQLVARPAEDVAAATQAQAWHALRAERHVRLTTSDIDVLPDRWAAMTDAQRAAWGAYRQALRDLPAATPDPTAPVWPAVPRS